MFNIKKHLNSQILKVFMTGNYIGSLYNECVDLNKIAEEMKREGFEITFHSDEKDYRLATVEDNKIIINLMRLSKYCKRGFSSETLIRHERNHIKLERLYEDNLIEEFKKIGVEFDKNSYSLYYNGKEVIRSGKWILRDSEENEVLVSIFYDIYWWILSYIERKSKNNKSGNKKVELYNSEILTNYLTAIEASEGSLKNESVSLSINKELLNRSSEFRTLKILHLLGLFAYKNFGNRYRDNPIELYPSLLEVIESKNIRDLESLIKCLFE